LEICLHHPFCESEECKEVVVDEVVAEKDDEEDMSMVAAVNPAL